jgi:hypothetical protein
LNFPDAGQTSGSATTAAGGTTTAASNNIGPELQGIVSQMANQIDSVKNVIGGLAKNNADTLKSIQDVKNAADRSYMIAMVGIGAGIAACLTYRSFFTFSQTNY